MEKWSARDPHGVYGFPWTRGSYLSFASSRYVLYLLLFRGINWLFQSDTWAYIYKNEPSWLEINLVVCIDTSELIPTVRLGSWSAPASYHNKYILCFDSSSSRIISSPPPSIVNLDSRNRPVGPKLRAHSPLVGAIHPIKTHFNADKSTCVIAVTRTSTCRTRFKIEW